MKKINFKVITLFPDLVKSYLSDALISKAIANQIIDVQVINLRDFSQKKYNSVDDTVFGGGDGMLLQALPLELSLKSCGIERKAEPDRKIIYLSPQGKSWTSEMAKTYSEVAEIIFICGRYAGVDQRFIHQYVDEEISIGDYVLSGGELPALVMMESISRFLPEVLGSGISAKADSFENGLLEVPQFTKPQSFNQLEVPATLLSGNHQKIAEWQKMVSILITFKKRPDLLLKQNIDWKTVQQFYENLSVEDKNVMDISDLELPR